MPISPNWRRRHGPSVAPRGRGQLALPCIYVAGHRSAALKPWLIEQLGAAALARLACWQGFVQNGLLLGVYGFEGDAARYPLRVAAAGVRGASTGLGTM